MKALTKRQTEVLDSIKNFFNIHKYPPTIREIAKDFNISVKGAYDHVKALEKKGFIKCDVNRSRAIEVINKNDEDLNKEDFLEIPILGNVAAGVPLFAEENLDGSLKLPESDFKAGVFFALRVAGDSMQNAGILDGDTAIFIQRTTASNGEIVVARINEEAVTLKRFFKEKNRVSLKAENPVYPPIFTQNVKILGKLVKIIRNYE